MKKKTSVSIEEIEKMAKLSRIGLTKSEAESATKDMSNILEHFSSIQSIDTKDTKTADDMSGLKNVAREDAPDAECLCSHSDLISNAPNTQNEQVKVHRTL